MDIKKLMEEKIRVLNEAAKAYYVEGREIMSNFEYDKLYDELAELEKESGMILSGSPTQQVGYEVLSELPKEAHPSRMLSLDKTKDRDALSDWLGNQEGLLSWKLDGLTIVLTYRNQKLEKAVTRGNGEIGEVITQNAKTFVNLPLSIPFDGELVIRGEAVITYADFEKINESIPELDAKYKNPRNLCSGSVRQLNSKITAERKVRFYAFSLVSATNTPETSHGDSDGEQLDLFATPKSSSIDFSNSREEQMKWLISQGFDIVDYKRVNSANVVAAVGEFEKAIEENPVPSDGLVLTLDDIAYSASLGTTAKFPRDSIAFKWRDQIADTTLREIEWSASRTGLINPVAIFDPVELEGTTVSRASLHNISIMEELEIGIGDTVQVYKANMIIPQIAENLTRSGNLIVPENCPVCGKRAEIKAESGVKTLYCVNPECPAKKIKSFTHFVARDAMDVDGLSEMSIEKLIARGVLRTPADIFKMDRFKQEIVSMEGFGEKSYDKLVAAAEKASHTTPDRLLYALGVPGIGSANAKIIAKACENSWERMQNIGLAELQTIDGVGEVLARGYRDFFDNPDNQAVTKELLSVLKIDESFETGKDFMQGLTFVITGSLNHYANRDELVADLEACGAKVAGSVSSKTSYLINNDVSSSSGKNKKAKELGIPIIDEKQVLAWLEDGSLNN
ncbi:MAG: NAD-dependent DNA ligase LigA [Firmicutes bacterium]|nr:NAD-dependent DNA ligase LigA [Bacillota bacterium]